MLLFGVVKYTILIVLRVHWSTVPLPLIGVCGWVHYAIAVMGCNWTLYSRLEYKRDTMTLMFQTMLTPLPPLHREILN
jgi:uncharacterized membrane protein YqjE